MKSFGLQAMMVKLFHVSGAAAGCTLAHERQQLSDDASGMKKLQNRQLWLLGVDFEGFSCVLCSLLQATALRQRLSDDAPGMKNFQNCQLWRRGDDFEAFSCVWCCCGFKGLQIARRVPFEHEKASKSIALA